ncbi:hypothetical protein DM01DRAFT_1338387 [Hesseltinella vesiculosa]|uniref:Uncharacterized protein n=1 Tax=Hesseltinella vesiculosa TaxID=101127 RepID=A0A1X2G9V0_9FUNG|nr:hypothetical protein DM01DRAFT_1338387 [Hesseltinella vesiculosa]
MDIKHSYTITHLGPSPGIMTTLKLETSLNHIKLGRRDTCWQQTTSETWQRRTWKS